MLKGSAFSCCKRSNIFRRGMVESLANVRQALRPVNAAKRLQRLASIHGHYTKGVALRGSRKKLLQQSNTQFRHVTSNNQVQLAAPAGQCGFQTGKRSHPRAQIGQQAEAQVHHIGPAPLPERRSPQLRPLGPPHAPPTYGIPMATVPYRFPSANFDHQPARSQRSACQNGSTREPFFQL